MSTSTEVLKPERWKAYFDAVAPTLDGMLATIEETSPSLGAQVHAEEMPLQALGYDPRDRVLEIAVGGSTAGDPIVLRHLVSTPQRIQVRTGDDLAPSAIVVDGADGTRTLVRLSRHAVIEA